jgi:hypothetical protein
MTLEIAKFKPPEVSAPLGLLIVERPVHGKILIEVATTAAV